MAATNFTYRFINDGTIRISYINQVKQLSYEYKFKVSSHQISVQNAAMQVNLIRNEILEAQRLKSSDIGRAKAVGLKKTGLTLNELTEKYSQIKYDKQFFKLSSHQKNQVYLEIIESSGRPRDSVSAAASKLTKLGQGLIVVTLGIAVYNIALAKDKTKATAKEGLIIGGGFAGGATGGALAGIACGPGAPVCVSAGVFIGGALGALGAGISFGWFF